MKSHFITSFLMLISMSLTSQDAREILNTSREKCQAITSGYYDMTTHTRYMTGRDTTMYRTKCYFKKPAKKMPFPVLFQSLYLNNDEPSHAALFTGQELVTFSLEDSTGQIMHVDKWKNEIKSRSDNYDFYNPFTSKSSFPLPTKSEYRNASFRVNLIGEEKVNGYSCYHIETYEVPKMEKGFPASATGFVVHFWINKADMLPVQISETFTMLMNKDTMVQYDLYTLNQYELNTPPDDQKFSLSSIPTYCKLKEYTPFVRPDPLPVDTIAPDWSFSSLNDEIISLESLKGKLVLVDFFYKSCMPCMQALPALQSLHEKYKNKGLVVIGLDPFDDKEDDLPVFLAKRGVDYTVLYASKEIATTYRVTGYPTMYLIGKDGRILNVTEGYSEEVEEKLEELILKHL